ncbi:MAG: 16S rRNA (guanine(527)-N(7))-methyltransferase RsmG [Sulfurospirillaceae bacterium]|nr:16S rRNA (guanine(527)-N(7))-methyltransferase RsmG [Sulfurospirillaceae bacterium]
MHNLDIFSVEFWQQCEQFTDMLLHYNQTHNITGAKTKEAVMLNIEDSIYPLQYLQTQTMTQAIDIGTGAGFPGFLLALALPHVHFTLFEPIAKKSAFLHLCKTALGAKNIDISTNRVEKVTPYKVDLISSRAVTNTKMLMNLCHNFIQDETVLLFYKGELVTDETEGLEHCTIYPHGKRNYLIMKGIYAN